MPRPANSSPQARDLLAAMAAQAHAWHYGYDLSRQTGLKSGTLYPLLIRLSDQGLLEAQWQEPERPGKPRRHAYRLTADGVELARAHAARTPRPAPRRRILGATT